MMDTDAAPVPTKGNSLAKTWIHSVTTDHMRKPLTEIEKIDVSQILELAKYIIMEIAAESNNLVLIEITRRHFLKYVMKFNEIFVISILILKCNQENILIFNVLSIVSIYLVFEKKNSACTFSYF